MKANWANMVVVAACILLCSCAHEATRPNSDHYNLSIVDNTKEKQFEVALQSSDERALCISVGDWPNASGSFTIEKGDTFLQVGNERLPVKSPLMSAYCPGGCGEIRVEPHGRLDGFISYEAFGDAETIGTGLARKLNFVVTPYYCR